MQWINLRHKFHQTVSHSEHSLKRKNKDNSSALKVRVRHKRGAIFQNVSNGTDLKISTFLAPTGALIVTVVDYRSAGHFLKFPAFLPIYIFFLRIE